LLAIGAALAAFALAFQWRQTDGCLQFYGGGVARAITTAAHVEVWHLAPGDRPGRLVVVGRCDVSRAAGLVHLRRGMVEDANFAGRAQDPRPLPPEAWTVALAFGAAAGAPPQAVVAIAMDKDRGAACLVGRPGRLVLGRIRGGLRTWVEKTCPRTAGIGFEGP
jgi:hypothetical protein